MVNKERKIKKTEQEIEEQLLLTMFRRIAQGRTDIEIMEELNMNDRKLYYYYKHNLVETSKIIQRKKFQKSIAFELQMLKDRILRIYRIMEQKVSNPDISASTAARCALAGQDLATYLFRLEVEGLDAVVGVNNFFDIMKRNHDLVND